MSQFLETVSNDSTIESQKVYDCIIIGSGVSGLRCAQSLTIDHKIPTENILVCEAQSYIGGRIKQTQEFVKGVKTELGKHLTLIQLFTCFLSI